MMPRPKSKWGRDAGWGMMLPDLSREFRYKISELLTLSGKELESHLNGIKNKVDLYRSRKEEQKDKITDGQVKQAAIDIKKQVKLLADMLFGEAGGMRPEIDYSVSMPLRDTHGFIFLEEFTRLLKGVENGCDHYLENIHPNIGEHTVPRIKALFAQDIMEYYITFFGEVPKTTVPVDYEGEASIYAQILQACFLECDNDIPSDGDLKKIMSWALNNRKD